MPFDALDVALQSIHQLRQPLAKLETVDRELARQLRRAAQSVPLNIAEGRQRGGKDRSYHYRVALGSAAEVVAALQVALAWGHSRDALAPHAAVAATGGGAGGGSGCPVSEDVRSCTIPLRCRQSRS